MHLPHMLPAVRHYRSVLAACHAGAELDAALGDAHAFLDDDLR